MLLSKDIITLVKRENCFDFLRYLFALSLIIAHFCTITGTDQFWFITGGMRVKAFFTITGFLVTYSFLRRNSDIKSYSLKRVARIVPAYVCCILFCIVLGWIVSDLPTQAFFSCVQTWKYAVSNLFMLNWIEPELPNTFQSNIEPQMNGSLWSMKFEVIFYVLVPFVIWLINRIGKRIVTIPLLVLCLVVYRFMPVQLQYCCYFFTGMILLLYFDDFCKYTKYVLIVAVLCEGILYAFPQTIYGQIVSSLEPIMFSSIIIGFAYNVRQLNFLHRYDNVTYGLYLYHFPVIQMLIHYGVFSYNAKLCFVLTIIISSILACLSWRIIEQPLIKKSKK